MIPCSRNLSTTGAVSMAANCRRQTPFSSTNHTFRLLNMTASPRPMLILSDEPRELNSRGFCGTNREKTNWRIHLLLENYSPVENPAGNACVSSQTPRLFHQRSQKMPDPDSSHDPETRVDTEEKLVLTLTTEQQGFAAMLGEALASEWRRQPTSPITVSRIVQHNGRSNGG